MVALRNYGEKKALHHCGNYCTLKQVIKKVKFLFHFADMEMEEASTPMGLKAWLSSDMCCLKIEPAATFTDLEYKNL